MKKPLLVSHLYVLVGQTPVPEPDVLKWAVWFEAADRVVARTEIGGAVVSTVFLGVDHGWGGGSLRLFETMIFGGVEDGRAWRCATWLEAEEQHRRAVESLQVSEK